MTKNKRPLLVALLASVSCLSGIYADGMEYGPPEPPRKVQRKDRRGGSKPVKKAPVQKPTAPATKPKAPNAPAPRVVIVEKPVRPSRLVCVSNFEKAPTFEISLTAIETARSKMDFQKVSAKTLEKHRVTSREKFAVTVTEQHGTQTATNTVDVESVLSVYLMRMNPNYIEAKGELTLVLKPKAAKMEGGQVTLGKTEQTIQADFDLPTFNDTADIDIEPKNSCIKQIKAICSRIEEKK